MNGHSKALINLLRGWPNSALLPTAQIKKAGEAALSDPRIVVPGLLYAPDPGYEPLRQQIAAWLTSFYKPQRPIDAERICITGGASQNLACVLQVYSDPVYTRNIWMVSPTYFLACRIFEDSGFHGRLRSVPEDEEGIDIEYLRRGLKRSEEEAAANGNVEPKLKPPRAWNKIYRHLIYAVPTFSNPTTKTMSLVRRQQLVKVAREYDALVITDDVYDSLQWSASGESDRPLDTAVQPRIVDVDRFMDDGIHRAGADGFGNSVSNGSFSKIVGPGCRTGWAEGTEKFTYGLSQCGSSRSGGAPSQLTATILSGLLESGEMQSHILTTLQPAYARRYNMTMAAIQRLLVPLGVILPQTDRHIVGGYFVWFSLPAPLQADTLAVRALEEENVIIAQGSLFGVYGDSKDGDLEREVRICIAWEEESVLVESIERLARLIRKMLSRDTQKQAIGSGHSLDVGRFQ